MCKYGLWKLIADTTHHFLLDELRLAEKTAMMNMLSPSKRKYAKVFEHVTSTWLRERAEVGERRMKAYYRKKQMIRLLIQFPLLDFHPATLSQPLLGETSRLPI